MHIKYVFGPKSGHEEHMSRESAEPLIRAGIAEEIPAEKTPYAPPIPKWSVELYGTLQKTISIVMRLEQTTVIFQGRPEDANARREWQGGGRWLSGFGRVVPGEIVKQYTAEYKKARPGQRLHIEAPGPNAENSTMAANIENTQRQLRENESNKANAGMASDRLTPQVLNGGSEAEVIYEKYVPGFN